MFGHLGGFLQKTYFCPGDTLQWQEKSWTATQESNASVHVVVQLNFDWGNYIKYHNESQSQNCKTDERWKACRTLISDHSKSTFIGFPNGAVKHALYFHNLVNYLDKWNNISPIWILANSGNSTGNSRYMQNITPLPLHIFFEVGNIWTVFVALIAPCLFEIEEIGPGIVWSANQKNSNFRCWSMEDDIGGSTVVFLYKQWLKTNNEQSSQTQENTLRTAGHAFQTEGVWAQLKPSQPGDSTRNKDIFEHTRPYEYNLKSSPYSFRSQNCVFGTHGWNETFCSTAGFRNVRRTWNAEIHDVEELWGAVPQIWINFSQFPNLN